MPASIPGVTAIRVCIMGEVSLPEMKMGTAFAKCM
jgi:hypothetical protein